MVDLPFTLYRWCLIYCKLSSEFKGGQIARQLLPWGGWSLQCILELQLELQLELEKRSIASRKYVLEVSLKWKPYNVHEYQKLVREESC